MAEPTNDELKGMMRELIGKVDLEMCGIKKFTKLLSKEFGGIDLSHKSKFIKTTLTEIINEDNEEEEDDETSEEEEEAPVVKATAVATTKTKRKGGGSQNGGGLAAVKEISPALSKFFSGRTEMARTDIVKELWAYIREHKLQDPDNKREIILDKKLKDVFGCDRFTMFTMNKYVGAHIHPFKPVDLNAPSASKKRKEKASSSSSSSQQTTKKEKKKRKTGGGSSSGLQAPYQLSPELSRVVGKQILPRPQVTKKLWAYIRANNLQNPNDKREILCDQKMKLVMGGEEKVTMFSMNKFITPHLLEKLDPSYYTPSDDEGSSKPEKASPPAVTAEASTVAANDDDEDTEEEDE